MKVTQILLAAYLISSASAARPTGARTRGVAVKANEGRSLRSGGSGGRKKRMKASSSSSSSSDSSSDDCHYEVMRKTWKDIKLTGENEVEPFTAIPFAFGTAEVELMAVDVNHCDGPVEYYACIETDIEGFVPAAMHIHRANIFENGDVVVDFTPTLMPFQPDNNDCVLVESAELFHALVEQPEIYYVNAHLGADAPNILQAIRGQLVQSFTAELENSQTVAPFNVAASEDATGMAKVTFEAAGSIACFDVTISEFDPALGHIHMAPPGTNGPRIFNYSSTKIGPGRFFGCMTLEELGVTIDDVVKILTDPEMYYFDYHLTSEEPSIFTSIRGQLPMN